MYVCQYELELDKFMDNGPVMDNGLGFDYRLLLTNLYDLQIILLCNSVKDKFHTGLGTVI